MPGNKTKSTRRRYGYASLFYKAWIKYKEAGDRRVRIVACTMLVRSVLISLVRRCRGGRRGAERHDKLLRLFNTRRLENWNPSWVHIHVRRCSPIGAHGRQSPISSLTTKGSPPPPPLKERTKKKNYRFKKRARRRAQRPPATSASPIRTTQRPRAGSRARRAEARRWSKVRPFGARPPPPRGGGSLDPKQTNAWDLGGRMDKLMGPEPPPPPSRARPSRSFDFAPRTMSRSPGPAPPRRPSAGGGGGGCGEYTVSFQGDTGRECLERPRGD